MVDPNFSGINPANLLNTISALVSGSKTLHGAKTAYVSRFQKHGLDPSSLTEIGKIASWVDDELPMLRRRQALAVAMEFTGVGPKPPMVQLREPILTVQQARAEGKKLAEDINKAGKLDPGKAGVEFHRIAQLLSPHKGDPDYTTAFYAAMDDDLFKNLPMAIAAANAPTAKEDTKLFGAAFTTAATAETPAPGFDRKLDFLHGDIDKNDPGAVFTRSLMQGEDPELWDIAWGHLKKAVAKLGDLKDTWSDHAGLTAAVIGVQSKYAAHFWEQAAASSDDANAAYQKRINAMTPAERRKFKMETRAAAKNAKAANRAAERVFSKFGMGPMSRLMEASVADGARWFIDKVPGIRPPSGTGALGRVLRVGGKLPLVGSVLTLGAIAWDIHTGTEKDVAIAANVGGMGAGMAGTWVGVAGVAAMGGPVGWGIAAGVVVGFGVGYGISYLIKETETGKAIVNSVSGAAKSIAGGVGDAAKKVGEWLGF